MGRRIGKIRSLLFTASAFAALGSLIVVSRSREPELIKGRVPARMNVVPLGEGEPWYGGKPTIPVRVESDVSGEVPVGEWIPARLSVFSDLECESMSIRIRGLDGLDAVSSEESRPCREGDPVTLETRVRILDGTSGILAVDVKVETSEGPKFVTRAVSFHAASGDMASAE
jgi:hypothetical protein